MSGPDDTLARAVDNTRALLATLLVSGWQEVHVVSEDHELFIALAGGRANPMRQMAAAPSPGAGATSPTEELVTAPHVATIVDVVAIGTQVGSGDRVAAIRVLDRQDIITAPLAGVVAAIHAQPGALVEFKSPILSLGKAGR